MSVISATRSEVAKQFSTSMWWILALVLVLYVGSMSGGFAFLLGGASTGLFDGADLEVPPGGASLIYSFAASIGYVFALLIGTLAVTNEFRHNTLTPTFLAVPRRGTALFAKVVLGVIIGLLYGLIALVSSVGAGAGVLAAFGIETGLGEAETWTLFGRVLLALVLWTVIGVGAGTLIRNQVAAIVGVLVFTQFLEPIARLGGNFVSGLNTITQYLPGAASDTLVGQSFFSFGTTAATAGDLQWWGGAIVLAVYALVFLLLGYLASWRRDIT